MRFGKSADFDVEISMLIDSLNGKTTDFIEMVVLPVPPFTLAIAIFIQHPNIINGLILIGLILKT